ncbi:MAG TPA: SurA N-terminal domain-containing protein [Thermohalobaculum sp.]|nr:SurA N-terminal domain-containing protein [Thermohalobaculum sp.]
MLNTIRHAVKSWPAKVLLALLIASFAIWGIGDVFSFRMGDAVAEVGDTEVPAERYADSLRRQQSQLSQQAGELVPFSLIQQLGIDRQVLAGLIRDAALAEELSHLGIAASDDAVAEAIRTDPAFQGPGGEFSTSAYQGLLAQQGMSPGEFEALTRRLLAQQVLSESVAGAVPDLPQAATLLAAYRGETRDVARIELPLEMAEVPEAPDTETLRAFYEERPDLYTAPERRFGRYIHVSLDELAEDAQPTDEAVEAAYEAQKGRLGEPPTRTIERVPMPDAAAAEEALARIEEGETTFEAVAEEQGLSAADRSLGTVRPDDLPAMTAEAVFAATEPGVIGPVPTPVGSSIVRITELTEGGTPPLEEVRDQLARQLAMDAALGAAPDVANRIEEARAGGTSLEDIAAEVGMPLGQFEGLAEDGTLADGSRAVGIEASPVFLQEVFQAVDLEERDIVQTPDGGFLLVMVDRIEETHLQPFEEVEGRVREDWQRQARLDALESRAEALAARLGEGETMEEIGTEIGLAVSRHPGIDRTRRDRSLPDPLVEALFAAPQGGTATVPAPGGEGVILAQVTAVTPLDGEALATAAAEVEEALEMSLAGDVQEYFGRAVEDRHGATINQSVLDEVSRLVAGGGGT